MTEAQLKSFAALKELPVYDEHDPRFDAVVAAAGGHHLLTECATLAEVEKRLKDPLYRALGALRAGPDGETVVIAFFGKRT
jgi:hypothetical protein